MNKRIDTRWLALLTGVTLAPIAQATFEFEDRWEPRVAATGVYGSCGVPPLACAGLQKDPDQGFADCQITAKWGTLRGLDGFPGLPNVTGLGNTYWRVFNDALEFHGEAINTPGVKNEGFALLSQKTFPHLGYISLEGSMRAYCSNNQQDNCFAGLALINGEGDYREIAFRHDQTGFYINRVAPCDESHLVTGRAPLQADPRLFRLDYYGDDHGRWAFIVDGVVSYVEHGDQLAAALVGDPRVGLYFTGERTVDGSWVQGSVAPVRVWTGAYADQEQTTRLDGYRLTGTTWAAQEIRKQSAIHNMSRIKLFMVPGHRYIVSAYAATTAQPQLTSLLNEVTYTATHTDNHDAEGQIVPMPIENLPERIWLVVRAASPYADIGTDAEHVLPPSTPQGYAQGRLFISNNTGASWIEAPRDLYFTTYERR